MSKINPNSDKYSCIEFHLIQWGSEFKEILNKIYKSISQKSLPSGIDSIIKEYPELADHKAELIAALEDEQAD